MMTINRNIIKCQNHILVTKNKVVKFTQLIFQMLNLSMVDFENIHKIYLNKKISEWDLTNIEYPGSKNLIQLDHHKKAIKHSYYNNSVLKYDSTEPYYSAANYLTRLAKIKFELTHEMYQKLENVNKKLPTSTNLILLLKTIFPNIPERMSISYDEYQDDWMIKLILGLNKQNNKQNKSELTKLFDIDNNDILQAKLLIAVIRYPNRVKQMRKVDFKSYLNSRLSIEFAWSIIQYFKGIRIHQKILNDMVKHSKTIQKHDITNYVSICNDNFNIHGVSTAMKLLKMTERLSALN